MVNKRMSRQRPSLGKAEAATLFLLAARRLPHTLIQTCWFNSDPVAFAGVSATTNHLACPHVAVESGPDSEHAGTIKLLGHLGGIKSVGPVALPLPRSTNGQIVFSGMVADRLYHLQWMRLILSLNSHPLSMASN